MSDLKALEKSRFERLFDMPSGYVMDFKDGSFGVFFSDFDVEIHDQKYQIEGTSKARKLRAFWTIEPNHLVGKVLDGLLDHYVERCERMGESPQQATLDQCRAIAKRLQGAGPNLDTLKKTAEAFNAVHLADQIKRMESSVNTDPGLAIGTAKELIETCCKTILSERGKPISGTPDVSTLTKETLKELRLVPEGVPEETRGSDAIKRLLRSLGSIGNDLAELRGLYGTGHGKHGQATSLHPRHAKLAVGAAATFATFLFETHTEMKKKIIGIKHEPAHGPAQPL